MSPEEPSLFQRQQLAFTAHIRDPDKAPVPEGIPPPRMAVYRELIFNGLDDQLSSNFPVLRSITSDQQWNALVRGFLARHSSQTRLFSRIGLEFIEYLQREYLAGEGNRPFLPELAHYEYAELAVSIDDTPIPEHDPAGDLLAGHPLVSPSARVLDYRYPVHRIGPEFLPEAPGEHPTHLVVYRDRQGKVHFLEINPVTRRLLELLKENPASGGLDILNRIAGELRHPRPGTVIDFGTRLLQEMHGRDIILGTATAARQPTKE